MYRKNAEGSVFRGEGRMPAIHAYISRWLIALTELLGFSPADGVWNV